MFFSGFGQTRLSELDISRLKQKSIVNFVNSLESKGVIYFENLHPSVTGNANTHNFDSNCHYFRNKYPIDKVWSTYQNAHPAKAWKGRVVSFGFIYSPAEKRLIFQDDPYSGLEVGQIFFIEMQVFLGLVHFPVSFVVTEIDHQEHLVKFSYVAEGSSKGEQKIKLIAEEPNKTKIEHSSIHQTDNLFRDRTLYPIYHRKAIKELHSNLEKVIGLN